MIGGDELIPKLEPLRNGGLIYYLSFAYELQNKI